MRRSTSVGMLALALTGAPAPPLSAQGHGPAYGLSTPTLGKGGWSLDVAAMARWGNGESASMLRPMLSYGITEDLQLSLSVPLPVSTSSSLRPARGMTRMPANRDVEALLGWRFHRQGTGIGSRFESTAFVGVDYPTDDARAGVETSPGVYAAVVTGYASRSAYAWVGGLYRRYVSTGEVEERLGDVAMYSLVLGYRPELFRKELPNPDWRIFLEVIGESARPDVVAGQEQPGTGGVEVFAGPTLLGLFGAWGISGGPVFPVYRDLNEQDGRDRVRVIINTTFWF